MAQIAHEVEADAAHGPGVGDVDQSLQGEDRGQPRGIPGYRAGAARQVVEQPLNQERDRQVE